LNGGIDPKDSEEDDDWGDEEIGSKMISSVNGGK